MHGQITVQKLMKGNILSNTVRTIHNEFNWDDDWTSTVSWIIDLGKALYQSGEAVGSLYVGDVEGATAGSAAAAAQLAKVCEGSSSGFAIVDSHWIVADDSFDQVEVIFRFWSEDELKGDTCRVVMRPVKAKITEERREEHLYQVTMVLNKADLDSEVLCFSAGAQDDGWLQDFAVITRLDIKFTDTQKTTFSDMSDKKPALIYHKGNLFLAWAGNDKRLNVMSSIDGVHFGNKVTLPEFSRYAPALASTNQQLYLVWTGMDNHINVMPSSDGVHFGSKVVLEETSGFAPALASPDGKTLYLWWIGSGNRINMLSSNDGVHFGNKQTLQDTSKFGLATAAGVPQPVFGWIGADQRLNVSCPQFGEVAKFRSQLPESSIYGMDLATDCQRLYVAWTGNDSRLNLTASTKDGEGNTEFREADKTILGETSQYGPALAIEGRKIALAWTGLTKNLNVMTFKR